MPSLELLYTDSGGNIWAGTSNNGTNWWHGTSQPPASGFVKTGHSSKTAPALVTWPSNQGSPSAGGGTFLMVMLATNDNNLYWRTSVDGVNWSGSTVGHSSPLTPSLMYFYVPESPGVGPWLAFVAEDGTDNVLVSSSGSGTAWSSYAPINQTSKCTPAFTGWLDNATQSSPYYVMVFVSQDNSNRLLACNTNNSAGTWSGANPSGQYSAFPPSLTGLGTTLYMAFISNDAAQEILVCSSQDGVNWFGATPTGQYSNTAPCMTTFNGELLIAFVAKNPTNNILLTSSTGGGTQWPGTNWQVGAQSPFTPAIANFSFQL